MTRNGAEMALDMIVNFFRKNMRDFRIFYPQKLTDGPFTFIHNYPKYGCAIVVILPFMLDIDGKLRMTGCTITVALKKTTTRKKHQLVLKSIRTDAHMERHLIARINLLRKLVLDTKKCPRCGKWMFPHISYQKPPREKTRFVSFYCQQCNLFTPTTYGIGLKQELHRRIKEQIIEK